MPFIYFLLFRYAQRNWSGTFNHKNYKIVFDDIQAVRTCNIFCNNIITLSWKRGYKDCFNFLEIYENIPRELLSVRAAICKKFYDVEIFYIQPKPKKQIFNLIPKFSKLLNSKTF